MNLERAIEFLIGNQARMDARFNAKFDRADQRFAQAEERFAQVESRFAQSDARFAQIGFSLRSEMRQGFAESRERFSRIEKSLEAATDKLSETGDKLNALIDVVNRHIRSNVHHRQALSMALENSLVTQSRTSSCQHQQCI